MGQIWSTWRRGAGDPTYRIDASGRHWRGLGTPEGAATLRVRRDAASGTIVGDAWGPGAAWALDMLPALLGAEDDPSDMPFHHDVLVLAARAHPHWRVSRSGWVLDALTPAIIEQKVTGQEAFGSFRRLVQRYGTRAPGPGADIGLWVQPDAAALRSVASWDWLKLSIDAARNTTIVRAARVADSLQRSVGKPFDVVDRALQSVPGLGRWTSAEVRSRAHGDPDAVSFGDYHVARNIGWALIGEEIDDDALEVLLEPYRGHRYRVQRLLEMAGHAHPRRGPRMAPRTHLPLGNNHAAARRERFAWAKKATVESTTARPHTHDARGDGDRPRRGRPQPPSVGSY